MNSVAALLLVSHLLTADTAPAGPCPTGAAGDPYADVGRATEAGVVKVLLDGGGVRELRSPSPTQNEGFGWSVRLAHTGTGTCADVIVGAPYAGDDDAGAVYIFSADQSKRPTEMRGKEKDAHFGWSLAAADLKSGALVAVGEPHSDDPVADAGAVTLLRIVDGAVESAKRLSQESDGVIGNGEVGDMWGWSLALGNLGDDSAQLDLAVGAPYENNDGTGIQVSSGKIDSGMVAVVFDVLKGAPYQSVKWDLGQATKAVPERSHNRFGWSLAYAEEGGRGWLAAGIPAAGATQLWERGGAARLRPTRTLVTSPEEGSGWSLAFVSTSDGLRLATGAPYANEGDTKENGAVRLAPLTGTGPGDLLKVEDAQPYQHLGFSLAAQGGTDGLRPGTTLLIGAPDRRGGGAVTRTGSAPARLADNTTTGAADYGYATG